MNEKRIALLGRQILEALCFLTDCGPSRASKIRVPLLATRTLNAAGQSRVTLSLRQ